jgi:hypothetical protein
MASGPFGDRRGSAFLFSTAILALLLIFGGIATDIAYVGAARNEIQRAMDAAALAGAGKLGFNATAFPAARANARDYALLNPYRNPWSGAVALALNEGNAPGGDIVLGIWENGAFAPSLDGSKVNAVRCRYQTSIPTSFLNLLGIPSLAVGATATAVTMPPLLPPPNTCVFPIGLTQCPFLDAGVFSSEGCGAPITFISSSGKPPGTTAGTNTAAWVNIAGTSTPNAPSTSAALQAAASGGTCSAPKVGTQIGTNNGMIQSVFDLLETLFIEKYKASGVLSVTNADAKVTYTGQGWEVFVPVIETACPPGAISGIHGIVGWTRFVITQVINRGRCAVANANDGNSWPLCPPPMNPAGAARDSNLRGVFGFYSCRIWEAPPSASPAPMSALATKLRLVQ